MYSYPVILDEINVVSTGQTVFKGDAFNFRVTKIVFFFIFLFLNIFRIAHDLSMLQVKIMVSYDNACIYNLYFLHAIQLY